MTPLETVDTWLERVWVQEDASTIDEMLVDHTKARGLDRPKRVGPNEFKAFHSALLSLIGDVRFDIIRQHAEGNWTSTLFNLNATRRDNGQPVQTTGQIYAEIVDGKIVDAYNHVDFMTLFEQLDLLPPGTFGSCLKGEKIG